MQLLQYHLKANCSCHVTCINNFIPRLSNELHTKFGYGSLDKPPMCYGLPVRLPYLVIMLWSPCAFTIFSKHMRTHRFNKKRVCNEPPCCSVSLLNLLSIGMTLCNLDGPEIVPTEGEIRLRYGRF